jgi:TolB protein
VVLAAASFTSTNVVHNAGITWVSDTVIRVAKVDGSGRRVLRGRDSDGAGDPSWTRDGRALAYYVRYSDTVRIGILWPKTHKAVELGSGASRSGEPTWSPDAKRIAVSEAWGSFGSDNPESTIKIVSVTTNKWRPVTKPERHRIDFDPAWSPDGRTIAFAREHEGRAPTLYLVQPNGHALRRLTKGRSPSWSPDATRLAFVLGNSVYEIRDDGRGRKRILGDLRNPLVRWSPDGAKLLYTSRGEAWLADTDGTHRTRVVHERYGVDGIAWRPGL